MTSTSVFLIYTSYRTETENLATPISRFFLSHSKKWKQRCSMKKSPIKRRIKLINILISMQ